MISSPAIGLSTIYRRRVAVATKTLGGLVGLTITPVLWILVIAPALDEALGGFLAPGVGRVLQPLHQSRQPRVDLDRHPQIDPPRNGRAPWIRSGLGRVRRRRLPRRADGDGRGDDQRRRQKGFSLDGVDGHE